MLGLLAIITLCVWGFGWAIAASVTKERWSQVLVHGFAICLGIGILLTLKDAVNTSLGAVTVDTTFKAIAAKIGS